MMLRAAVAMVVAKHLFQQPESMAEFVMSFSSHCFMF